MSKYVDGFVIPIQKNKLKAFEKMAKLGRKIWMEYGALDYYECVGDDLNVKFGLTFPKMCKLKSDETVIFAFIVYKSKAQRDKINIKVMKDPRMQTGCESAPFDIKRFAMGGFKVLVDSK
jgi:uncharacterized protein YbaA (DUF1428 family)